MHPSSAQRGRVALEAHASQKEKGWQSNNLLDSRKAVSMVFQVACMRNVYHMFCANRMPPSQAEATKVLV